jgi:hypothetical protein
MRTLSFLAAVTVALHAAFEGVAKPAIAQTPEQAEAYARVAEARAKVLTAQAALATAVSSAQTDAYTKVFEARAKLISAQAALIAAIADANKANAEARLAFEQARGLSLDNHLKEVEAFYKKRRLNAEYCELYKSRSRLATETLLSADENTSQRAKSPEQLFNPQTGEIRWPLLLRREQFAKHRAQFEELLLKTPREEAEVAERLRQITKEMYASLRSLIREVPSGEYVRAKVFIRELSAGLEKSLQAKSSALLAKKRAEVKAVN